MEEQTTEQDLQITEMEPDEDEETYDLEEFGLGDEEPEQELEGESEGDEAEEGEEAEETEETEEEAEAVGYAAPQIPFVGLTEEERKQAEELFDPDQLQFIEGLVRRVVDQHQAATMAMQHAMRYAGVTEEIAQEYGNEIYNVLQTLPVEARADPQSIRMAVMGAVYSRVAAGADMAEELEKAATLLRGQRNTARKRTAQAQPQPQPVPRGRSTRAAGATARTRPQGRRSFLMEHLGLTPAEWRTIMGEARR